MPSATAINTAKNASSTKVDILRATGCLTLTNLPNKHVRLPKTATALYLRQQRRRLQGLLLRLEPPRRIKDYKPTKSRAGEGLFGRLRRAQLRRAHRRRDRHLRAQQEQNLASWITSSLTSSSTTPPLHTSPFVSGSMLVTMNIPSIFAPAPSQSSTRTLSRSQPSAKVHKTAKPSGSITLPRLLQTLDSKSMIQLWGKSTVDEIKKDAEKVSRLNPKKVRKILILLSQKKTVPQKHASPANRPPYSNTSSGKAKYDTGWVQKPKNEDPDLKDILRNVSSRHMRSYCFRGIPAPGAAGETNKAEFTMPDQTKMLVSPLKAAGRPSPLRQSITTEQYEAQELLEKQALTAQNKVAAEERRKRRREESAMGEEPVFKRMKFDARTQDSLGVVGWVWGYGTESELTS